MTSDKPSTAESSYVNAGDTLNALSSIIFKLSELCCEGTWDTINARFDSLDVKTISLEELICYLRVTFIARENISSYNSLLQRTYDHIKSIGEDPDKILQGLFR